MKVAPFAIAVFLVCWTVSLAKKHVHFKIYVPEIKQEIHHEKTIYQHIKKNKHKESHYDHHHHHADHSDFGGGHESFGSGHEEFGGGHESFGSGHEEFGGGHEDYGDEHGGHVEYSSEGGHGWDED